MTTGTGHLAIDGLGKHYGGDTFAMRDVTLEVSPGEAIAVVGASGCGKSTLLRLVAGFETPTEGRVLLDGRPVTGPGPDRGVVFQDYGLFPWLSVRENIAYGLRERGVHRREALRQATEHAELVGLGRFVDAYPHTLSGGMQQRVGIARVLALHPSVLLMDEPLGALDALTRRQMQDELVAIRRRVGTTLVLVTHSIEEAVYLADRVVVMAGGASHGVPGQVSAVVPVDLGDRRDTAAPDFQGLAQQIGDHVHSPLPEQEDAA
ncbi:ABC transporter ATP-binding protein [Isoptericola halotolerans]|uniref:NitT/TauT family transport system ATP-binding protein n=1 Tax=Isoptericola halotolerans TaxID=300560 RepID=A0ABX1ZXT9_9MICO|nr:ABC transporter ATP-binding protein [Isoptericola halotolerans]NOV95452.1 NitT/TauT family transport system ATP-binding protein [Isoptericola halotolerans]